MIPAICGSAPCVTTSCGDDPSSDLRTNLTTGTFCEDLDSLGRTGTKLICHNGNINYIILSYATERCNNDMLVHVLVLVTLPVYIGWGVGRYFVHLWSGLYPICVFFQVQL